MGGVARDEALRTEVGSRPQGVQHIGDEQEVQHLFDENHVDRLGGGDIGARHNGIQRGHVRGDGRMLELQGRLEIRAQFVHRVDATQTHGRSRFVTGISRSRGARLPKICQ